jgi:hypothetical protein
MTPERASCTPPSGDAEDARGHGGEQGGGGGEQIFEAVALDGAGERGEEGAGVLVLREFGEDLDEVLLRGLGEVSLQTQLGGGEGALATDDGEAEADVAEGGDLVGAPGAAEVGLGAEARGRAGQEVFAGLLVALLEALADVDEAELFGGGRAVVELLADRGDDGGWEEICPKGQVGELVEVAFEEVGRGGAGG